jgi:hypothetical protein
MKEFQFPWIYQERYHFARTIAATLEEGRGKSWKKTVRREERLLRAHGHRWLEGLEVPIEFCRGFPATLLIGAYEYLQCADDLVRIAPVQSIVLTSYMPVEVDEDGLELDEDVAQQMEITTQLAACPALSRWLELEFTPAPGYDVFLGLLQSPHLNRLQRLVASGNEAGEDIGVVVNERFANLRWLDVCYTRSVDAEPLNDVFIDIVTSPHLARLEYLDFGFNSVTEEGLVVLASSPTMERLRSLNLRYCRIGSAGLRALAHSTTLKNLKHLDVSGSQADNRPGDSDVAMLLESPLFDRLTCLNISSNAVTDDGVRLLARSPRAANLRALVLGGFFVVNPERNESRLLLTTDSVRALADSPFLSGLRRLELPVVIMDDETAILLARSRRLKGLREVDLCAGPGLTKAGWQALQERFGDGLTLQGKHS